MRISKLEKLGKNALQQVVDTSQSIKEVLEKCGLSTKGTGNYQTAQEVFRKLSIDTKEIKNRAKLASTKSFIHSRTRSLEEVLIQNSNYNRFYLKRRLIEAGILEEKCEQCSLGPNWCNKRLCLQLDHRNGINTDNRKENLRLLCPNCHSQTKNFAGKKLAR